jgi:hypothetical protein
MEHNACNVSEKNILFDQSSAHKKYMSTSSIQTLPLASNFAIQRKHTVVPLNKSSSCDDAATAIKMNNSNSTLQKIV